MRSRLGILAIVVLGVGLAGCGGSSSQGTASHSTRVTTVRDFSTYKNDRDNDGDHNDDDAGVLDYGHAADATDHRISVALVTHYFAAAAADDGARACSLLIPFVAESVVENEGHTPGLHGKTCAVVMSKLFKQRHAVLAMKSATLKVIGVRVEGNKALAILDFPTIPEVRQITERRDGSTWKLEDLLDGILE